MPDDALPQPLWLLAELTYRCPLQCPYCSNPIDLERAKHELDTEDWLRVLAEARALGAVQLGLSGGEPLARKDLEIIVAEARRLGFYSNLLTSGYGLKEERIVALKAAGLDHIQLSFQASEATLNDRLAGTDSFAHKQQVARWIKAHGYPMVLNIVLHRHNLDAIDDLLAMALELGADYLELANTQYYGWALANRDYLLPTRQQLDHAEARTRAFRDAHPDGPTVYFVVPDYFDGEAKPCMAGWGQVFMNIAPDGTVLPCHAAADLPGMALPNVREHALEWIWRESPDFNRFRGQGWMQEPCKSCDKREEDFGGCRCQAYQLTGDLHATDPACHLSPDHHLIQAAVESAAQGPGTTQPIMRNPHNARHLLTR